MDQTKSLPDLMRDLLNQLTNLVRDEIQLAKAEMSEKTGELGSAAGMFGGALAFAVGGIVVLMMSGVYALSEVVQPWLAALIVGVGALILSFILLSAGKSKLSAKNLAPSRTARSVQSDAQLVKEKVR